jgi:hypothetical protein
LVVLAGAAMAAFSADDTQPWETCQYKQYILTPQLPADGRAQCLGWGLFSNAGSTAGCGCLLIAGSPFDESMQLGCVAGVALVHQRQYRVEAADAAVHPVCRVPSLVSCAATVRCIVVTFKF